MPKAGAPIFRLSLRWHWVIQRRCSFHCLAWGGVSHFGILVHRDQVDRRFIPSLYGHQTIACRYILCAAVTPAVSGSRWKLFTNTYLVTALNPKGIIFFVAFLPQFVSPNADAGQQLWILAITFVALATLNATLYAVFATSVRKMLASRRAQRRFNLVGGTLLSSAGVWALLAKRPV
ncbi:LysE family translocator [Halomonas sp. PA16-9]|nr:LysE family translocator [Halomonas sp. PA16-9]